MLQKFPKISKSVPISTRQNNVLNIFPPFSLLLLLLFKITMMGNGVEIFFALFTCHQQQHRSTNKKLTLQDLLLSLCFLLNKDELLAGINSIMRRRRRLCSQILEPKLSPSKYHFQD